MKEKDAILVIFGAGAEKNLGFPTTQDIENIFKGLCGFEDGKINKFVPLKERLQNSLKGYLDDYAEESYSIYKNLELTLRILLDGDKSKNLSDSIKDQKEAIDSYLKFYDRQMFDLGIQNDSNKDRTILERSISNLVNEYDWKSLKSLVYFLYKDQPDTFKLIDFLGILYDIKQYGLSLPLQEYFNESGEINYPNIDNVFRAYYLILYKIFKGIYFKLNMDKIRPYYDFIDNAIKIYKDRIKFASFNWNPFFVFLTYRANYNFNHEISNNGELLRYVDHSTFINIYNMSDNKKPMPAFTENVNEFVQKFVQNNKLQSIKFFTIHGLFNLRACPKCSSVFMIYPKRQRDLNIPDDLYDLFLVDPLPSEIDFKHYKKYPILKDNLNKSGRLDEIDCPFCNAPTTFKDTMLDVQIMFNGESNYFSKKALLDFATIFSNANHIISLGYSFPDDDVKEMFILKAFKDIKSDYKQKLSLVLYDKNFGAQKWLSVKDISSLKVDESIKRSVNNAVKLFNVENIRISFQGVPKVFFSDKKGVDILEFHT